MKEFLKDVSYIFNGSLGKQSQMYNVKLIHDKRLFWRCAEL